MVFVSCPLLTYPPVKPAVAATALAITVDPNSMRRDTV
ncbi:Uncharacterised protein [Mycobacteroides abscessus subsp. abscessus]|nr:Uncharacterised protein [Mycobacteroides abscessus subsp. abscessus]